MFKSRMNKYSTYISITTIILLPQVCHNFLNAIRRQKGQISGRPRTHLPKSQLQSAILFIARVRKTVPQVAKHNIHVTPVGRNIPIELLVIIYISKIAIRTINHEICITSLG